MLILCLAEDSCEISSILFSEKNEKVFMNVVCCRRDWRFNISIRFFPSNTAQKSRSVYDKSRFLELF